MSGKMEIGEPIKIGNLMYIGERYNPKYYKVEKFIDHNKAYDLYIRIGKYVEMRAYNQMSLKGKKENKDKVTYEDFCRWMGYKGTIVISYNEE